MTKKDYVAIAREISALRTQLTATDDTQASSLIEGTLNMVTYQLADVMHRDNERFDRSRFYTACGVK